MDEKVGNQILPNRGINLNNWSPANSQETSDGALFAQAIVVRARVWVPSSPGPR